MSNNVFSCKSISSLTFGSSNFKFCMCIGHMMSRVLGNTSFDLDLGVKVGQIMYFLVNASSPKPLAIATSKFTGT